jgi:hypothetical protein
LFRVATTDKLQGDVQIVVLKSSNLGDIIGIKNIEEALASKYMFKEITLSLRNTDSN